MTQGYEANHSGSFLEELVARELVARGFLLRTYAEDKDNLDLFAPCVAVRQVPYLSLYGCDARRDFSVTHFQRKICIECRYQNEGGSVDEKFPYFLRNAVECIPEPEIIFAVDGNGARPKAIAWLKRESLLGSKQIHVLNINELLAWTRAEFARAKVA